MCPKWICIISCVLLAGLVGDASAGVVFVTQVTAASNSAQGCIYAINGSGLTGDLHDNSYFTLWLTAADSNGGGYTNPHPGTYNPGSGAWTWIKFNFDDVYHLGELWVWNYNENTGRGFKNVVIEYTSDGATWKKLGDYVFAKAPGTTNYAHNTTIDFNGVEVNSVIITTKKGVNTGNWGGDGNSTPLFGLSEVRFYCAQDSNASEPNPANGATWVALDKTLSWTAGVGAQSHNVYFGTTSPGTFRGNQTEKTFNPGPLAAGTTYYWRIDEVNGSNTLTGNVWSFTTRSSNNDLVIKLNRGITLDRQFRTIPPEAIMTILPVDIQIIKSMGFEFVKLIVNPALMKSGSTINSSNMWYLDEIVNRVLNEGLKVVVCIHPEDDFKVTHLGDWSKFQELLGFYEDFAAYMAARWDPNELAFQLMTEPRANAWNWNTMQPLMWQAVRNGMPNHTLILSGDQCAIIEGLINVEPVDDNNVMYCFEAYEPFIFTFQGGGWAGGYIQYLRHVPWPSNPTIISSRMTDMLANVPAGLKAQATTDLTTYGSQYWNKSNLYSYRIGQAVNWANNHNGRKLFVGEWGVYYATAYSAERYQFTSDLRELLEENNIGWAYWSYNETQTVLDPGVRVAFSKSPSYNWIDETMLHALGMLCDEGDINCDGIVDYNDLEILARQWLQHRDFPPYADIVPAPNGDDMVNFLDFAVVAEHWLE